MTSLSGSGWCNEVMACGRVVGLVGAGRCVYHRWEDEWARA